ncbi:MAG: hypothetical protein BWK77_08750 [Verrucomicrobia bacterium A1]|nr:MAG: hypothetical protein BWK77_08750 [Verrucomicrobia bacterium A1]
MHSVVVIGLGNPLMSDEGIGIHVIQALEARAGEFPGVDFLDAGASGMTALHAMAGRRKAVFVDCARMGELPGSIRRFTPDQVVSGKVLPGFSLHEGDLLAFIRLSERLGECPKEIVIFGIEPASVESGQELSAELTANLSRYQDLVVAELRSG